GLGIRIQSNGNVFSAAYCIIAASSAANSNAGFLEQHVSSEHVYVQNASGKRFWSDKHFALDPQFPKRLLQFGDQRIVDFISSFFQDYTKGNLTIPTDRCVAISGLENCIKDVLKCKSRYGIFQKYLHRNLLWTASGEKVKKIAYEHHVPSWSWMAYSGGIQFMNIAFNAVHWIDNLRFDEECECDHAIVSNVWKFQNCTMELHGALYKILDSDGMPRGWVQYDIEDGEELDKEWCIVVGRIEDNENDALGIKKYYILVVRPTSVHGEYKRVGIGLIQIEYLVSWGVNVRIV
ncbi:hypothetical protein GQ43DRAFT_499630, partial [Delitschia confertaspora ATCC 74209]